MKRSKKIMSLTLTLCIILACNNSLSPTINAKYDETTLEKYEFKYSSMYDTYLTSLREDYNLTQMTSGATSDLEKAKIICSWVYSLWKHHSSNTPKQSDPIYILEQVMEGERFRCVEYGIVISGCLNSIGLPSRVIGLKTKDMETRYSGAGHIAAEVYLEDLKKWVFIDGQFGVIPLSNEIPLSSIELKNALAFSDSDLTLWRSSDPSTDYFNWISDYLYFFTVNYDQRVGYDITYKTYNALMLVPLGEDNPQIFQRYNYIGDKYDYTNCISGMFSSP